MLKSIQEITIFVVIALFVGASIAYPVVQPVTAQNMTGNQSSNQTGGLDLVPPRVIEEEAQEEIVAGQQ